MSEETRKKKERIKFKKDLKKDLKFEKSKLVIPKEIIEFLASLNRNNARIFGNVTFNV
jgi:uncharacterized protein VirK/YbjX